MERLQTRLRRRHADPSRVPARKTKTQLAFQTVLVIALTGFSAGVCFLLAIPYFPAGARPGSTDSAAIATMRDIASAQAAFQSHASLDRDGDGVGEFGYFADLASESGDHPPPLPRAFLRTTRLPSGASAVRRSGYYFKMFLPDAKGVGVPNGVAPAAAPDVDQAERKWCCYAWPVRPNDSGKRVFFVDQEGVVRWRYYSRGCFDDRLAPAMDGAVARHQPAGRPRGGPAPSAIDSGASRLDGRLWSSLR